MFFLSLRLCCRLSAGFYYSAPLKAGQRASVAISADGQRLAVAVEYGSVLCSADGGRTWRDRLGSSAGRWRHIGMSSDGNRLLLAAWDNYLQVSTNFGESWGATAVALGARKW